MVIAVFLIILGIGIIIYNGSLPTLPTGTNVQTVAYYNATSLALIGGGLALVIFAIRTMVNGLFTVIGSGQAVKEETSPVAVSSSQATQGSSRRLQQLKEMLDSGLITQQDYEEQKKKLLGNL